MDRLCTHAWNTRKKYWPSNAARGRGALDFREFWRGNDRVGLLEELASVALVVERTRVRLGVTMRRTEVVAAPEWVKKTESITTEHNLTVKHQMEGRDYWPAHEAGSKTCLLVANSTTLGRRLLLVLHRWKREAISRWCIGKTQTRRLKKHDCTIFKQ